MDKLNLDDTIQSQRVGAWVHHVKETLGSLTDLPVDDIASRNRPWSCNRYSCDIDMEFKPRGWSGIP